MAAPMDPGGSEELWRQCVNWLVRWQVLPPNHRLTAPGAVVFDLAQVLRDGVLLCHLANTLQKNAIESKDIKTHPQMSQFLCIKNISAFVTACRKVFDLSENDVFDPHMLFDVSDFQKVLKTLSKLSKTSVAQRQISGFPQTPSFHSDEKIYEPLEKLASEKDIADEDPIYDTVIIEDHDDKIYEDLVLLMKKRPKDEPSVSKPVERRDYVIRELVETEKNYVDALNMIIVHFYNKMANVITSEEHDTIFKYIKELHVLHASFHSDLHRAWTSPLPPRGGASLSSALSSAASSAGRPSVSECFLKYKAKFVIYGNYCSHLPHAQRVIDDVVERRDCVRQLVDDCQQKANEGRFKLRDVISLPMQRVLKYHLLLKDLQRSTPDSHDDKVGLQKALDAMLDLNVYINEMKRDMETLEVIKSIEASILDLPKVLPENTELNHYGRLIKDGELRVRQHGDSDSRPKARYCFLFDKVLLLCAARRGDVYAFRDAHILDKFILEDQPLLAKATKEKWSLYFLLVEKENKSTVIQIYTKTEDVKTKWIEAITLAQANASPDCSDTGHELIMYTCKEPTYCTVCRKLLRGAYYQGYRCKLKRCDAKVHKECIKKSRCTPENGPRGGAKASSAACPPPVPPRNMRVRATQSFKSGAKNHLNFNTNDIITVISGREGDEWWKGKSESTSQEGIFPRTHVTSKETNGPALAREAHHGIILEQQPWYVGVMERSEAESILLPFRTGTFLVRSSTRQKCFAISVKYQAQVKHILIRCTEAGHYYVSDNNAFQSVMDLVKFYRRNSLSESFKDLNTMLATPYKGSSSTGGGASAAFPGEGLLGYCTAKYPYYARETNMLSFDVGDRIAIISKAGEHRGWWKGELNGKVGYFPCSYVEEEDESGSADS